MSTICGVQVGRLAILEEVLWEWTIAQEKALRLWRGGDVPWWYGERASLSFLAGAVWRAGGIVLEEYSVRKTHGGKEAEMVPGRNDMYFGIGRSEFILEAKHVWPKLRSKEPLKAALEGLKEAEKDVRKMEGGGIRRLAIVSMAPSFPRAYETRCESLIDSWIGKLRELKGAAKAWTFPDAARRNYYEAEGGYYPGVALLVKEVDLQSQQI